ncbi:hypothetical protein [Metamycoplasma hyosynoviae]|uniref:hypothetical protein n=1 Tax=Metamycoplasma hyosynoviae TaxID=29559 RepID=UPI002358FD75|nr:hypothetical protein [Metamycoplasma hyosynoviae]MDC8920303.1 hypothetical protein [Metamycoplasma hyosynoviae]MDD1366319.1 hypothetical protein [Metamycoplasma hyosynoviae]MDD1371522.1 hypothetical protein [Metamycoplasma hyosynoviae]MDD7895741.1 hypothetical protein [Metamycoplasma hyosynoviae]
MPHQKKNIYLKRPSLKKIALFSLPLIAISTSFLFSVSCKNPNADLFSDEKPGEDVNRDEGLIGEELAQKVREVIENAAFKMTDFAKKEYQILKSSTQKDKYIQDLWEKIKVWFKDSKDSLGRYVFYAESLSHPDFSKYLDVYIPNLRYFAGNHIVYCYFDWNAEKRNIYYYFKIRCLDGKQTEGSGKVFLDLGKDLEE